MLALTDTISQSIAALRAHKLRTALTLVGLTMGVATLIAVMTIVQGANLYVEQKVARLGSQVFQISKTPFTLTDWDAIIRALRYKKLEIADMKAVRDACANCQLTGASINGSARLQYRDKELNDINMIGHTANMASIDTRTLTDGRYFTDAEDSRSAFVCLIGADVLDQLLPGANAIGQVIRIDNNEFTVLGAFERIGSVLGQNQDNFVIIPMNTYLRLRGTRNTIVINVKAGSGDQFDNAMDEARQVLRARRHVRPGEIDDFFFGTKDSFIELWKSISSAFFAVFIMVSSISAVVGGIVIMNVMLVSVTERTKEIGVRRAIGATKADIVQQFLAESVIQCLAGGAVGILGGFLCALALRTFTSFPASVQTWVALLGFVLSSFIGLFFGIYPAMRASRLDPVVALRSD